MTYQIYSQQQLQLKSIARLKQIYSEIACTVEVNDKRSLDSWITAITKYQASKIQKLAPAAPDNQATAQAELDSYIVDQAQVVAPEPLRIVEISFDHHEYYAGDELIASISHDDNHLTQRWVVMVNDKEVFRANTLMRCDRFICTHYKDGTLPVQEQLATPCTTENQIMAHIFNECQNYGFEILDDGIYNNKGVKLGQVGCTDGNWWVKEGCSDQQQYSNSVLDAVRSLSMVDVSTDDKSIFDEYFLDQPLDRITAATGYSFRIVIGNQYRSGQHSIGWHNDNESSMGLNPAIASVSLGSVRKFQIKPIGGKPTDFWLEHGSLLVMHPGCQSTHLHQVPKTNKVVSTRINLTFRPHTGGGRSF